MTILQALRERLLSQPALTALVGNQVYSMRLPQNIVKSPCVLLQEVDRATMMHFRGATRLFRSRVQMDSLELDRDGALQFIHTVADAANGWFENGKPTGLLGWRGKAGGVEVVGVLKVDQRERYEPGARVVKVEIDYYVWFREPLEE